MEKNAAKDGQCSRSAYCTKGKGHAGWCKTKGGSSGKAGGQDQDSLFASLSNQGRKQPTRGNGKLASRSTGMQELARKREVKRTGRRAVIDDDDEEDDEDEYDDGEEEEEEDGDGVEYADYGMSRSERRAMRDRADTQAPGAADSSVTGEEEDGESAQRWDSGGGPAPLVDIESLRLKRQTLEKWLLEPFFTRVVRGCVVRIGLQCDGLTLYRCAEVTGVKEFEEHPYLLGQRRTCKRLQLEFGESRMWYPMSSVSNQPFEELELRSWQQLLEVVGRPMISANQLRGKTEELYQASHHQYSEADVTRRIEEERKAAAQAGKPTALTTRQKMAQQHSAAQAGGDGGVAAVKKFQRNVLGQAIVTDE